MPSHQSGPGRSYQMRFITSTGLLALSATLHLCSAGAPKPSGAAPSAVAKGEVVELTESSFDTFVKDNQLTMVKFFTPCTNYL